MSNIPVLTAQSPISQIGPDGKAKPTPDPAFYRFINAVRLGFGVGSPQDVVATASPMVYNSMGAGYLAVAGGTVTKIEYSVDRIRFFDTGLIAGLVPLQPGTQARITYSGTPTLTFIPGAA